MPAFSEFEILDGASLRLRFRKPCGLGLNRDHPFLDGHDPEKWVTLLSVSYHISIDIAS
jgi:hypothetical protein